MNWKDCFDSFILNDNKVINDHIDSITCIDMLPVISDWEKNFGQDFSAAFTKFVSMALLISRFEQAWAKFFVDFESCINNVFCY